MVPPPPCSDTCHGPYTHSERGVKAIADVILGHGNVTLGISTHSYSQVLVLPCGYKRVSVPSHQELLRWPRNTDVGL